MSRTEQSTLIRVRRTLNNAIRAENYYMALQLYKSLYSRYDVCGDYRVVRDNRYCT